MNFLALKLDERTKTKIRRFWWNLTDATEFWLISVAVILLAVAIILWYGLVQR